MPSTNSTNYGNILLTEEEFQRRYDKHSIYNPENCCEATSIKSCEANLINCCGARALESPESLEVNKVARALETSNNKIAIESPEANKIKEIEANISWVRQCLGYNVDSEEALEKYNIYKNYREEGQTIEVSKQYAGLL